MRETSEVFSGRMIHVGDIMRCNAVAASPAFWRAQNEMTIKRIVVAVKPSFSQASCQGFTCSFSIVKEYLTHTRV